MTRHSGGEWLLVVAACLIAAFSACGSGDDDDDGSGSEEPCFDNAADSDDCAPSSGSKPKPSSSSSTSSMSPSKPATSTPLDAGTPVKNSNDAGREPPRGGSSDGGSPNTSSDSSSNDDWVTAIVTLVEMADRTGCDMLERDSKIDMAAQELANDRDAMPDVGAKYHWDAATTDNIDTALEILRTRVAANAYVCSWHRYGIGVAGDPGGTRRIVLMLAE